MTAWNINDASSSVSANVPTEWLERSARAVTGDDGQIPFYRSDGSPLVTSETFNMAALGQHLAAHPELVAGGTDAEVDVEIPPIHGPAFKGELLYAYWSADGEQPVLVPVATVVVRGRVEVLTQAVTVGPTGEILYGGNRYQTGTAPMADGQQARIVVADGCPSGDVHSRLKF
jgi:hypothetical protein